MPPEPRKGIKRYNPSFVFSLLRKNSTIFFETQVAASCMWPPAYSGGCRCGKPLFLKYSNPEVAPAQQKRNNSALCTLHRADLPGLLSYVYTALQMYVWYYTHYSIFLGKMPLYQVPGTAAHGLKIDYKLFRRRIDY